MPASKRYIVKSIQDVPGVRCPCGTSYRALTARDNDVANVHVTHIAEARTHYHKATTEFYYILEGSGTMDLDGERFEVAPGTVILIRPGCRHAGRGGFKARIVGVPPFCDEDEFFD